VALKNVFDVLAEKYLDIKQGLKDSSDLAAHSGSSMQDLSFRHSHNHFSNVLFAPLVIPNSSIKANYFPLK